MDRPAILYEDLAPIMREAFTKEEFDKLDRDVAAKMNAVQVEIDKWNQAIVDAFEDAMMGSF